MLLTELHSGLACLNFQTLCVLVRGQLSCTGFNWLLFGFPLPLSFFLNLYSPPRALGLLQQPPRLIRTLPTLTVSLHREVCSAPHPIQPVSKLI